jgi:uncharacterized protein YbjT (DUF2867 family)
MQKIILVAGATGNLGGKITYALLANGAHVKALVRAETAPEKIQVLRQKGAEICQVQAWNKAEIARYCIGVDCVVSALSGLRETIIDAQKVLLDAAVEARVARFIPSDFSIDFTNLRPGQNRNLDFRRDFKQRLDAAPIKATSIFNGAFMELLTTDMPLIMDKQKKILCWGNPAQTMEFTTTHNIAEYTALAALDATTPRALRIAGERRSSNGFVQLRSEQTGTAYKLFRPGGIGLFNIVIKLARFFSPGKTELYPAWQGMQYMRDMMEGRVDVTKNDNARYSSMLWTNAKEYLHQNQK